MTAFDRFDPFERRMTQTIDEIAGARLPEYLDDIFRQTARTSQRPRWTFLERWLPVDTAIPRPGLTRPLPVRPLLILALAVALIAAAAVFYAGSRQRVPPPFGPAGNGVIAFSLLDDLYVRDTLTGASRVLVGGAGVDAFPFFSPDGRLIGFSTTVDRQEYLKVANADGSNVRQLLPDPPLEAGAVWRPDSRAMAVEATIKGVHRLLIVPVDGTAVTQIDLGVLEPSNMTWRPPTGDVLLFRGWDGHGAFDLYTVRADGTGLHGYGLPGSSALGTEWTLTGAAWSPDGGTIAYNAIETDPASTITNFRIGLIRADGTRTTLPGPANPDVQEGWPAFSPDGRWIVVHRWQFKVDSPNAEGWLAIMPADGSAPARDIGPRIAGGEDSGLTKVWSPDGSRILARAGNTAEVFSIDPVTGSYETLQWTEELPDWQRIALP
jgi:hypothetical protein